MKSFKTLLTISLISLAICISCSDDDNDSKVSVEKGKISLKVNDKTELYKISTIQSIIRGDTTTIVIRALSEKDSTSKILVVGFQRMVNFKIKKYDITGEFDFNPDTTFVYSYIQHTVGNNIMNEGFPKGSIDVVDYYAENILQAKLSYLSPIKSDTTDSASMEITGEINLDYAYFDPERVANLPITPGTMVVAINDSVKTLKATSAHLTLSEPNKYTINGTMGSQTIVIELVQLGDASPQINKEYVIGQTIDSIYTKASYSTSSETTFWADSGRVTISKITSTTLQGYFGFNATLLKDKTKKKELKNGKFYTKMKSQQ